MNIKLCSTFHTKYMTAITLSEGSGLCPNNPQGTCPLTPFRGVPRTPALAVGQREQLEKQLPPCRGSVGDCANVKGKRCFASETLDIQFTVSKIRTFVHIWLNVCFLRYVMTSKIHLGSCDITESLSVKFFMLLKRFS